MACMKKVKYYISHTLVCVESKILYFRVTRVLVFKDSDKAIF